MELIGWLIAVVIKVATAIAAVVLVIVFIGLIVFIGRETWERTTEFGDGITAQVPNTDNGITKDEIERIAQSAVETLSNKVLTRDQIAEIIRDEVKNLIPPATATATPTPTATATPEPQATATANPTVAPTATTEPTTQPTVKSTPDPGSMPSFDELPGFNPVRDFQQVCGPEQANPCIWDVGTEGIHYDVLGRDVIQVGIAKGVLIEWDEGNLKADPGLTGFCSLVVLTPNSWFENLEVHDANVSTYNVDARDVATWMKVLAVQAAQEQHADYGCPEKTFEEIPQWGSPIPSPPCGVEGWANCSSDASSAPSTTPTSVPTTSDAPDTASCETVNCMARRGTAVDCNGKCDFKVGEAVTGYTITMSDGKTYHQCLIEKVTQDGFVIDGVVNPWKAEAADDRKCDV